MIVTTAALISFAILAGAGAGHVADLARFQAALEAQRVWPAGATRSIAILVSTVELAVGVAGLAITSTVAASGQGHESMFQALLLAAATFLYVCYAIYGLYLFRERPGAPCGCSQNAEPIGGLVVARAATLAGLALVSLLSAPLPAQLPALDAAVTTLASLGFGLILWQLPAALGNPFVTIAVTPVRPPPRP